MLNSVPAGGGEPKRIVDLEGRMTQVLPDSRWVLVTSWPRTSISRDYANIHALSLNTLEKKLLIEGGYDARYVPTGHLVFSRNGVLMAVPFDVDNLEVGAEPQPVLSGVGMESLFSQSQLSFSNTGTLVYSPGGDSAVGRIARVDRQGKTEVLPVPERVYGVFDLSSDDRQLAVQVADVNDYVWVYDLQREEGRRLAAGGQNGWPKWNPSGDSLAVTAWDAEDRIIVERRLGAPDARELVRGGSLSRTSGGWSPDGRTFSFWDFFEGRIGFVSIEQELEVEWLEPPPGVDYWGMTFSPDGRWFAYNSNETGQNETWIRSFPLEGKGHQISTDGGAEPVWADSGELFYHVSEQWMVVRVSTRPRLQWSPPEIAFETAYVDTPGLSFDISSDGQHLYFVKSAHPPDPTKLIVVQNWF